MTHVLYPKKTSQVTIMAPYNPTYIAQLNQANTRCGTKHAHTQQTLI